MILHSSTAHGHPLSCFWKYCTTTLRFAQEKFSYFVYFLLISFLIFVHYGNKYFPQRRCMNLPKWGKLDKAGGKWYTRQSFGGNKSYKEVSKVI